MHEVRTSARRSILAKMLNETWTDQYERMMRSEARFRRLASPSERASEQDGRDALYHFCQDALHLRDWIKADPTSMPGVAPMDRETQLRALFNDQSTALAACADVANGSKHFQCDRKSYTTGEKGQGASYAQVTGQGVTVAVPTAAEIVDKETMARLVAALNPTMVTTSNPQPADPDAIPAGFTQYKWFIETDWNALDLAAEALADWDTWLKANNLL